jgi:hypothetical protein
MNNIILIVFLFLFLFLFLFYIISYIKCVKCVNGVSLDDYRSHIISRIMRGSARWSLASKQDKSPLVAILHANYGCAYLWALKDVFSDYEIKSAIGIDVIDFQNKITNIQDLATKNIVKLCPEYASGIQDEILSIIAGHS